MKFYPKKKGGNFNANYGTRVEGNSKNLYLSRDSLTIIRRSKKKLMIKAYCAIFPKLIELISNDFHERIKNGKLFLNQKVK